MKHTFQNKRLKYDWKYTQVYGYVLGHKMDFKDPFNQYFSEGCYEKEVDCQVAVQNDGSSQTVLAGSIPDHIIEISGKTYNFKDLLKLYGFSFNKETKTWKREAGKRAQIFANIPNDCWAKTVTGIDETKKASYVFEGEYLEKDKYNHLIVGSLVLSKIGGKFSLYRIDAIDENDISFDSKKISHQEVILEGSWDDLGKLKEVIIKQTEQTDGEPMKKRRNDPLPKNGRIHIENLLVPNWKLKVTPLIKKVAEELINSHGQSPRPPCVKNVGVDQYELIGDNTVAIAAKVAGATGNLDLITVWLPVIDNLVNSENDRDLTTEYLRLEKLLSSPEEVAPVKVSGMLLESLLKDFFLENPPETIEGYKDWFPRIEVERIKDASHIVGVSLYMKEETESKELLYYKLCFEESDEKDEITELNIIIGDGFGYEFGLNEIKYINEIITIAGLTEYAKPKSTENRLEVAPVMVEQSGEIEKLHTENKALKASLAILEKKKNPSHAVSSAFGEAGKTLKAREKAKEPVSTEKNGLSVEEINETILWCFANLKQPSALVIASFILTRYDEESFQTLAGNIAQMSVQHQELIKNILCTDRFLILDEVKPEFIKKLIENFGNNCLIQRNVPETARTLVELEQKLEKLKQPKPKYRWLQAELGKLRKNGSEEQKAFLKNLSLRSKYGALLEAYENMPPRF